jgi:hypothetical protein
VSATPGSTRREGERLHDAAAVERGDGQEVEEVDDRPPRGDGGEHRIVRPEPQARGDEREERSPQRPGERDVRLLPPRRERVVRDRDRAEERDEVHATHVHAGLAHGMDVAVLVHEELHEQRDRELPREEDPVRRRRGGRPADVRGLGRLRDGPGELAGEPEDADARAGAIATGPGGRTRRGSRLHGGRREQGGRQHVPRGRALHDEGEQERRIPEVDHLDLHAIEPAHGLAPGRTGEVGEGEGAAASVRDDRVPLRGAVRARAPPEPEPQLLPARLEPRGTPLHAESIGGRDDADPGELAQPQREGGGGRAEQEREQERDAHDDADEPCRRGGRDEGEEDVAQRGAKDGGFHGGRGPSRRSMTVRGSEEPRYPSRGVRARRAAQAPTAVHRRETILGARDERAEAGTFQSRASRA